MRLERSGGRLRLAALWAVPVAFSAVVYYPITRNYFHEDDFFHLYQIVNLGPLRFFLHPHAGHLYLSRNAVFLAFHHLFGTEAAYYFWGTYLTHLANVALFFFTVRALTGSAVLASFGAALWGISPLNEEALGWYSVYGQALGSLALLAILHGLARAANRGEAPGRTQRVFWYAAALVAASSFGTGLAVAMALPFAAALLRPAAGRRTFLRTPLLSLVVVVPALYLTVRWLWSWSAGQPLGGVPIVMGSLPEFVALVAEALAHLVTYAVTQLAAYSLYRPADYPDAAAVCVALAFAGLFLAALVRSPADGRRRLAALALLVLANYGSIAAGRSWLFAGGPAAATATRYHYMGSMLLAVLLCAVLAGAFRGIGSRRWRATLLVAWLALAATAYATNGPAIDNHAEERRRTGEILRTIRVLIARTPKGKDVYILNRPFRKPWFWPPQDFPGWAGVFVIHYPNNVVAGHRVHFVTRNAAVLAAAKEGRRTATLFVERAPGRAPAKRRKRGKGNIRRFRR